MGLGIDLSQLPDWVGTAPGWITSAGVVTLVGLFLRYNIGLRTLRIEASQVDANIEADLRDHYAEEEVSALRTQLNGQGERHRNEVAAIEKRHREAITKMDERHESCARDRDHLRDKVSALKDLVAGLRRIIVQNSATQAIHLGGEPDSSISDEVAAAAERVELLFALPAEPYITREDDHDPS